ncbi:hypothetical protein [Variovorax sp. PMC12]|uniref:hypothetical protein n=1 Tax=Variovorax sp. PMC12 TaxID=2126319 RepID=UPI000D122B88|nr:hypothetical protein [Variovorax sp. PMC12]AVQ81661.1 hypothetical protein C4F17_12275 [Variovorax sp. PMC12]
MTAATSPTAKIAPDWERIELDFRAGIKSLREIADGSGVSHVTISKHAKRAGWVRDLTAKIQAKADDLVNKALVNAPVNKASAVSERETIDANAQAIATVKLGQRRDVQRSRSIVMRLMDELELQAGPENADLLAQLGDLMRKEDDKGQDRLNDLYQKIVSLPGRAKTMKDLGESLRVLIALERQAFGLDDKDNAPVDALTSLLHGIANSNGNAFQPVARDPEHDED